tara:strand:+ start:8961 stop:9668 length:708 start_codon:yes stop_codon:yes gene_type:complete
MTIVKSQIRRGPIAQMPILDAGELGLASDQNRIFIGTEPRIGTYISSETIGGTPHAIVNFSIDFRDDILEIDLDTASPHSYDIFVNDVLTPGCIIENHNVKVPNATNTDEFKLKLNQEIGISNTSEEAGNFIQYTQLQNSSNTLAATGIAFDSSVKTSVTIDYYVYTNTMSRNGQMRISVNPSMSPVATITDTYDQTGTSDLVFSMNNGELMFNTSDTADHEFTYKQTSFKKRPV